jgi:hypothetical protein
MAEMSMARPTAAATAGANGQSTVTKAINVVLSCDEVQYILSLLGAETIPGLDPDTAGERSAEMQRVAQTVALRGLRARELAQQRGNAVAVHNALLAAVGVCAYPQKTLFAYHWPVGAEAPIRFFGHSRNHEAVIHTRPEADLHLFSRLPSPTHLVTQLLVFCECNSTPAPQSGEVQIPKADFAEVRRLAEGGDTAAALDLLLDHRLPSISAQSLVNTLSNQPRVSIVQLLRQRANAVEKEELTLVQNARYAWLVRNSAENAAQLRIKATQRAEIEAFFNQWVVGEGSSQ